MILDEAEPELTGYVHVTAVLPVNSVILKKFSKRLRQFIAKYRTSATSLCSYYWREGKQGVSLRITNRQWFRTAIWDNLSGAPCVESC
jgi:hypothetical protein